MATAFVDTSVEGYLAFEPAAVIKAEQMLVDGPALLPLLNCSFDAVTLFFDEPPRCALLW